MRSLKYTKPVVLRNVRADAVCFEIEMLEPDLLRLGAAKEFDQIIQAETLPRAGDCAERLLRDYRAVDLLELGVAVITGGRSPQLIPRKSNLAKLTPARFQVAETSHLIQLFEHYPALLRISFDLDKTF